MLFFAVLSYGEVSKTVNISAGELSSVLTAEDSSITNLTIKGKMDSRDFETIRNSLSHIVYLDLSNVSINAYSSYAENALPSMALGNIQTLESVKLSSTITDISYYAFYHCIKLTTVEIPSSVTNIAYNAFGYCTNMTTIKIPSSVTTIGMYAFGGDTNLESVYVYSSKPSTITSDTWSSDTYENCTLYVPTGSLDNYKNNAVWGLFKNIVESTAEEIKENKTIHISIRTDNDGFEITGLDEIAKISVYNISGKIILPEKYTNGTHISLNNFSKGVYLISITSSKGTTTQKIIKKN